LGYVFPSVNEGFGLPVLEAFSFGLPVIISRQGALMEVAGDAALIFETSDA
jgi:glycosyltransferase involved in cell wall biosynthesis